MMQKVISRFILLLVAIIGLSFAAQAAVNVQSVTITPANPDTTDTLDCAFIITGNQASYNVQVAWRLDGSSHSGDTESIVASNNSLTSTGSAGDIEAADTSSGDSWQCVVTATDGSAQSTGTDTETIDDSSGDRLEITDVSADCSPDNCDDDDLSASGAMDGDAGEVREISPGADLTLKFRVRNTWPSDEDDHDISNIELECDLEDIGDEDSQTETIDFNDLDPGDRSDREEMIFSIADDADEDTYTMDCTLNGDDDDGTNYNLDFTVDVRVEKADNSVIFTKTQVTPATVSCDRNASLDLTVQNVGGSDEDDVDIVLSNSQLGIVKTIFVGDLQEGDGNDRDTLYRAKYDFIVPKNAAPGTYDIQAEVFFNDGDDSNLAFPQIIVQSCVPETTQPSVPTTPTTPTTPSTPQEIVVVQQPYTPSVPEGQTITKPETTEMKLDSFTVLLGIGVLVLLIIMVIMVAMLFRRK